MKDSIKLHKYVNVMSLMHNAQQADAFLMSH